MEIMYFVPLVGTFINEKALEGPSPGTVKFREVTFTALKSTICLFTLTLHSSPSDLVESLKLSQVGIPDLHSDEVLLAKFHLSSIDFEGCLVLQHVGAEILETVAGVGDEVDHC